MIIEKVIHLDWCDEDLKATPNGVDIWEKDGKFYFTWEAAIREAKAQGVRLPTQREWKQSFEIIGNSKLFDFLKLNYAGYRDYSNGQYLSQGLYGYYWSSTLYPNEYTDYSYFASFYSGSGSVSGDESRKLGFSVRCIKN